MQNNNQAKTEKTKRTEAFLCPFCGAPYKELIPAGVVKVTVTIAYTFSKLKMKNYICVLNVTKIERKQQERKQFLCSQHP
jgi:hypothetical protein